MLKLNSIKSSNIIFIFAILLNILNATSVFAETTIKPQPSQLTVVSIRCIIPIVCNDSIKIRRTLILESTAKKETKDNEIKAFRVIATDFERKDNIAILPAQKVYASLDPAAKLLPGKFLSFPIEFDINSALQSGEYSGNIILEHSQGDLFIPVTLKIKDSFSLALPVLIFGVLLAFGLAAYQTEGFDRDEINIKIGRLRLRMQSEVNSLSVDQEVAKIFQTKVESQLINVENHLDEKNWVETRKGLLDAQDTWVRWSQNRQSWIEIYKYHKESLEPLIEGDILKNSTYGKELGFEINQLKNRMADFENPQKFSDEIKPIKDKIQVYLNAKSEYEQLNKLRIELKAEGDRWQIPLADLERGLNHISPDDTESMEEWHKKLSQLKQEMMQMPNLVTTLSRGNDSGVASAFNIQKVPSVVSTNPQQQILEASWRLKLFRWGGQGIAIALLCGAGFNQLYVSNATFGANPVADYASLLAWGFTAEVTRESVAKVLQRFRLPGGS